MIAALSLTIYAAPSAMADSIDATVLESVDHLNVREGPTTDAPVSGTLAPGSVVHLECYTLGTPITGPYGTTVIWYALEDGGWVTDAFVYTGTDEPITDSCASSAAPIPSFDGRAAAEWALRNAEVVPYGFDNDCTFFVSQALWAGGLPQSDEWTNYSWNISDVASRKVLPGPTRAAASADYFKNYIVNSGLGTIVEIDWADNTAGGAMPGDVIGYDWDPPGPDGILDHLALVTSLNDQGYPSVTQHSPTRVDRYWSWNPTASSWIEFAHQAGQANPRVYLIHINS